MIKKKIVQKKPVNEIPVSFSVLVGKAFMISKFGSGVKTELFLSHSPDGINFEIEKKDTKILDLKKKKENISKCSGFNLTKIGSFFVMTYFKKTKNRNTFVVAKSKNLRTFNQVVEMDGGDASKAVIHYDKVTKQYYVYRDGLFFRFQTSKKLSQWPDPVMFATSRQGMFDSGKISILGSYDSPRGPMIVYDALVKSEDKILAQVGAILFEPNSGRKIIWRSEEPLWQGVIEFSGKKQNLEPLGFVEINEKFFFYWLSATGQLIVSSVKALFKDVGQPRPKILEKYYGNPIIEPRMHEAWEGEGTFNPGAFQDEDGAVHLFYRAIGRDGISRVGYARSLDGRHVDKRLSYPIFEPSFGYGIPDSTSLEPRRYFPSYYTSGGGWSGAEDPRIVRIGDRIYMTYVAFEGWNSVRIALTSISVQDFKKGLWKWKKPILISPPDKVNKNWLLFPEKINGKFAILHSIVPEIMVEYVDDLDQMDVIKSSRKEGPQPGREYFWDNRLRGAGPPPVKTDIGWLLLYHATDKYDPGKYKLGAMILDPDDPTKVLYRSNHPILSPDMHYENNGKPGVVYASGATIKNKNLFVYYGGADRVVCVAQTPLKKFLNYMTTGKPRDYELEEVVK